MVQEQCPKIYRRCDFLQWRERRKRGKKVRRAIAQHECINAFNARIRSNRILCCRNRQRMKERKIKQIKTQYGLNCCFRKIVSLGAFAMYKGNMGTGTGMLLLLQLLLRIQILSLSIVIANGVQKLLHILHVSDLITWHIVCLRSLVHFTVQSINRAKQMAEKFNRPNKSNEFEIQVTSEKNIFSTQNVWVCLHQHCKKPKHRQNRPEKYSGFLMQIYCKHKITIALRHDFIYLLRQNEDM